MAKREKYSLFKIVVLFIVFFIVGAAFGVSGSTTYNLLTVKSDEKARVDGTIYNDFQIHFLELGNKYAGDCIYVKSGDYDIIIDAGSRSSSAQFIKEYVDNYCTDGKLEYVIATHAHQDHIAAFTGSNSLLSAYDIGTIIDFSLYNKETTTLKNYYSEVNKAVSNGASHYSALDCYNNIDDAKRVYSLGENISLEILYNYYYENKADNENDYSVCVMFTCGTNKFLLTGDLEEKGEEKLAEKYGNSLKADLFKAGHHGSYTASSEVLLSYVSPSISVVTCAAGSSEYTKTKVNQFPSQAYINRISKYTDRVYVTTLCTDYDSGAFESFNGNIIVSSNKSEISVACSNNNTILKDSDWFKDNRELPQNWEN